MLEDKDINLEDDKLENKDIKDDQETVEDKAAREAKEAEEADGDDDKKEPVDDPYDKKLKDLEKDNTRKSTALVEKNKKIQDLKDDLENQGFDEDKVNELVEKKLEEKMGDLGDIQETKKELREQLDITKKSNIDSALDKVSGNNEGKKKIYKHFLDNEVNKDLSFEKQIEQAKILGDATMNDEEFQEDVKKANENNVNTSGNEGEDGKVLSEDEESFSSELFQTKEGKAEFKRLRKAK